MLASSGPLTFPTHFFVFFKLNHYVMVYPHRRSDVLCLSKAKLIALAVFELNSIIRPYLFDAQVKLVFNKVSKHFNHMKSIRLILKQVHPGYHGVVIYNNEKVYVLSTCSYPLRFSYIHVYEGKWCMFLFRP